MGDRKWVLEVKDVNEWHETNVTETYDRAWVREEDKSF